MKLSRFSWLGLAALLAACPATSDEVRPPADQLFFPSGLALGPGDDVLFVANANSELRYDTGTIATIDLDTVEGLLGGWLADGTVPGDPAGCENCCEPDPNSPSTLICNEKSVLVEGSLVRIGNFAASMAVQELENGNYRLFLPVRGDPSITWVDYDVSSRALDCGGSGATPLCDNDHRLTDLVADPNVPTLSDEPWGIYVDSGNGYGMVTHLTLGTVTLVDMPTNGEAPVLADALGGLFVQNPATGVRGATGVAGRIPGSPGDIVYVTSRAESRIQTLSVYRSGGRLPILSPGEFFFLDRLFPSDDSRGISFDETGETAFVVNRDPPTLQLIDTSLDETGFPNNQVYGAVEICIGASILSVVDARAYVSCFSDSRIWVVDTDRLELAATIDVGRGANATAISPSRGRLYVSNFLEDTISVIDITRGSPTENRVVMQLGRERQSGGE